MTESRTQNRLTIVDQHLESCEDDELAGIYSGPMNRIAMQLEDDELDDYVLDQFAEGLFTSGIYKHEDSERSIDKTLQKVIAVCAVHNSDILVGPYIEHYKNLGISDFVFINNNSTDSTLSEMQRHSDEHTAVEVWETNDRFDGFKAMGWKQRMFYYYGLNKWYLNLDIDEHLVYEGCEKLNVYHLINTAKKIGSSAVGAMLVDMYSDASIADNLHFRDLRDLRLKYKYFDRNSYMSTPSKKFKKRIWGGPRTRLFNRHPSLQKFPLAFIGPNTLAINPHFWYPYEVNLNSLEYPSSALLHYKFLPGDIDKYRHYVDSGVHWDMSSQYRSYVEVLDRSKSSICFYDKDMSAIYLGPSDIKEIVIKSE